MCTDDSAVDGTPEYGMLRQGAAGETGVERQATQVFVGQFSIGKAEEVEAWILEQDGHPFIELRTRSHRPPSLARPADAGIRIPANLLPELKRLVQRVEERLVEHGLSDEFQTLAQLHEVRRPLFAHPSEAEFARILDFYKIRWQYEPKTFPIQWDAQGHVVESFTPDFYLPDQDLYIELTTRKQNLVTKKNRKVRLLKRLYPEVNIKIFYGRDFRQLLQKYGRAEGKK
jgi:hypothetical protein